MPFSKSRLFITYDVRDPNVWFVRTDYEKFARIKIKPYEIDIWFYPYHFARTASTVTDALKYIERKFGRYYYDTYFNR